MARSLSERDHRRVRSEVWHGRACWTRDRSLRRISATPARPTVGQVYAVVDAVLLGFLSLLFVHAIGLRTWRRRLATSRHRRRMLALTVLADAILPLLRLVGLPLAVGAAGYVPPANPVAAWSFITWTLPGLGYALLGLAFSLLAIGGVKLTWLAASRRALRASATGGSETAWSA